MFLFKPLHFVKPVQTHGKARLHRCNASYKQCEWNDESVRKGWQPAG
ncbi:TPA: hypothetical protein HH167_005028 [Escherichia coli]|nr:hypothetical protein [Escherichia coli]ESD20934.1 hypothetical protein HMPREF1600_04224 [Escherichia coli 907715]CDL51020.1 hypothetical protein [Escherichia coli ISC41]EFI9031435.1 hypothetical protein [Escherichia coli]HAH4737363.1 hypothetical protein [Escherichia coli]